MLILITVGATGFSQDTIGPVKDELRVVKKELATPVPLEFDREKMSSLKKNPQFNYSEKLEDESWGTTFKRYLKMHWQNFLNWLLGDKTVPAVVAFLIQSLPYLLILFLIGISAYLFSKFNPFSPPGQSAKPGVILEDEEQIIRTANIRDLINKAIEKENYRLAVRYHFLYILQQLSEKEIVAYDPSKTDEDYLSEISSEGLKVQYRKVNRIYDFIWYGDFMAGKEEYQKIQQEFRRTEVLIIPGNEQNL
ncbi:hypothetical protein [Salinimicrobium flavum]|uniref:DUF4129 domain-containing protein n=1 Tax=Salinimicrobium flavum TaxID=1737065 RepID=A0ABW5J1S0_9FLAO